MNKDSSLNKIWFLGRSYEEYMQMFDLTEDCLKDQKVLDCASGANSFIPRVSNKGYNATVTDILYNIDLHTLERISSYDFNILLVAHSGLDNKVNWDFFKNPEDMIKQRIKV